MISHCYHICPGGKSVTEAVKMRDIARNTKAEVQLLKYDKDGCLMLVEQDG